MGVSLCCLIIWLPFYHLGGVYTWERGRLGGMGEERRLERVTRQKRRRRKRRTREKERKRRKRRGDGEKLRRKKGARREHILEEKKATSHAEARAAFRKQTNNSGKGRRANNQKLYYGRQANKSQCKQAMLKNMDFPPSTLELGETSFY